MTTWKVTIPRPKAKRLAGRGNLIVTYHHGWGSDKVERVSLGEDTTSTIEIPDQYDWAGNTKVLDGVSFSVEVEYVNASGSRREHFQLKPQKQLSDKLRSKFCNQDALEKPRLSST